MSTDILSHSVIYFKHLQFSLLIFLGTVHFSNGRFFFTLWALVFHDIVGLPFG